MATKVQNVRPSILQYGSMFQFFNPTQDCPSQKVWITLVFLQKCNFVRVLQLPSELWFVLWHAAQIRYTYFIHPRLFLCSVTLYETDRLFLKWTTRDLFRCLSWDSRALLCDVHLATRPRDFVQDFQGAVAGIFSVRNETGTNKNRQSWFECLAR